MLTQKVILVDKYDHALGEMEKMEAHEKGILHRAFSIFIFNAKGELLLQQRAKKKYHGGGLWTNSCCSHPQWNEDIKESAVRRLQFEMGLLCELQHAFSFIYHTPVENGLIEHEYDHVYIGYSNENPIVNVEEVENFKWISMTQLKKDMNAFPEQFTFWFKQCVDSVIDKNLLRTL